MTIPDFAVSSQEAGFDKFLKVYNEYFKFDFFGNANFYGAKNGEDYQTGQAWITPITPSQAIALLTNQTPCKMNTLENTCFQFDGSYEAKECIYAMNDKGRLISKPINGTIGNYYFMANNDKQWDLSKPNELSLISPSDYIALLTGKQLTEGESDLVSDSEREAEIAKFKAYPYDPMSGNIEDEIDHAKRNIYKRGFKDGFEKANSVSHQQTAHLQQQLNTLTSEIKRFQEKYDENGYDCSNEIKLLRIENHIDSTLSFYHKEVTDLQQQLKEAKGEIEKLKEQIEYLEKDIKSHS